MSRKLEHRPQYYMCNSPPSWQHLINNILFNFLYCFVQAYLGNIFMYSKLLRGHYLYVCQVLEQLREAIIQVDMDKWLLYIQKTKFLGFIISTKDIEIDLHKVSTILNWAQPTSLHHFRSFLGFWTFYQRFIWDFFKLAKLLTSLTKKDTPFDWLSTC